MRLSPLAALLLALPLCATDLACGSEKTLETDEGTVTVDSDDETVTFSANGENGFEMKTGKGVELPKDFPEDVPVYPEATLVASMASPEGVMLSAETTAEPADVVAFYKEQLGNAGWTVDAEMSLGPQRILSVTKAERQLTVTAAADEGRTQISLTVR